MYYTYSDIQRRSYDSTSSVECSKFVLLGTARTGSTWLLSLLASHRNVAVYGELFEKSNNFLTHLVDHLSYPLYSFETVAYFDEIRANRPVDFLKEYVFRPYALGQIGAVGFKLFYDQPDDNAMKNELWDFFLSDSSISFIHLKRKNYLRSLVSLEIANATSRWVNLNGESCDSEAASVFLSFDECLLYFVEIEQFEECFQSRIAGRNVLTIYYEDLLLDTVGIGKSVQDFLHLSYQELDSPLRRQSMQPLSSLIVNYDDLAGAFAASKWARFFADI